MMTVQVKQATIADVDQLAALFNQYRIFYGQDSDLAGARNFLFERFVHRESVIFVIQDDSNQLLGFAQLYPSFSSVSMERSWILNDLFVQPEYRGKRLAQQLLAGVKQYAQLTKSKGISLATGIDNEIAQRIYEQQGFVREDAFYHYYLKLS